MNIFTKSVHRNILIGLTLVSSLSTMGISAEKEKSTHEGVTITDGAMYRANQRRSGVFQASGVTTTPEALWTVQLGGTIQSSPVVLQDTLYIGSPAGIHALNTEDGSERWLYEVDGGVDSSACVANESVFFTTVKGQLLSLHTVTGEEQWAYTPKKRKSPTRSSPTIAYGNVFSVVGEEIVACDFTTGKKIYTITKNTPMEFSSLVGTDKEFYGTGTMNWGYCFAYDYATARTNWRSNGPFVNGAGVYFFKTPAIDVDGSIYFNVTRNLNKYHPDHTGSAPSGQRGRIWNNFLLDKQVDDNELIAQSCPTPYNGLVYAGRMDGKFVAASTKDGSATWMKKYSASCLSDPSVAAPSNLVIFGCDDGELRALHTDTGKEQWSFSCDGPIFSSPWISDKYVYVATKAGSVYALTAP